MLWTRSSPRQRELDADLDFRRDRHAEIRRRLDVEVPHVGLERATYHGDAARAQLGAVVHLHRPRLPMQRQPAFRRLLHGFALPGERQLGARYPQSRGRVFVCLQHLVQVHVPQADAGLVGASGTLNVSAESSSSSETSEPLPSMRSPAGPRARTVTELFPLVEERAIAPSVSTARTRKNPVSMLRVFMACPRRWRDWTVHWSAVLDCAAYAQRMKRGNATIPAVDRSAE